ncbi:hypothetical protein YSY43_30770 [Paenibacillus sp. YSY-4.3]
MTPNNGVKYTWDIQVTISHDQAMEGDLMTEPSDRQLAASAIKGDFEAFRAIVLRYSKALLSVAYSVLGDYHEAQDAVQETFVKCHRNLHTLKDPSQLGSWLYSIAHRTSLDFIKKKNKLLPYDEATAPKLDNIHTWLDQHAIKESVWAALQTLEEKSKSAIVLYYLNQWPMKDIAPFLDLSIAAVESRIRRAREMLKLRLAGDFESYFRPYQPDRSFEQMVCEQVLKRAGHFYIPVSNKKQTTSWFFLHFNLKSSSHGNLLLESGHELYLLESVNHLPREIPLLTFSVSDANPLWLTLTSSGVRTEPIIEDDLFGKSFIFYDPDGNKFNAVENV